MKCLIEFQIQFESCGLVGDIVYRIHNSEKEALEALKSLVEKTRVVCKDAFIKYYKIYRLGDEIAYYEAPDYKIIKP